MGEGVAWLDAMVEKESHLLETDSFVGMEVGNGRVVRKRVVVGNSSPQRGERERGGEEGAKTLISLCLYRLRFLRTLSSLFPVDFDPR